MAHNRDGNICLGLVKLYNNKCNSTQDLKVPNSSSTDQQSIMWQGDNKVETGLTGLVYAWMMQGFPNGTKK